MASDIHCFDLSVWQSLVDYLPTLSIGLLIMTGNKRLINLVERATSKLHVASRLPDHHLPEIVAVRFAIQSLRRLEIASFGLGGDHSVVVSLDSAMPPFCLAKNLVSLHFGTVFVWTPNTQILDLPPTLTHLDLGVVQAPNRSTSFINFANLQLSSFDADLTTTSHEFQRSTTFDLLRYCGHGLLHIRLITSIGVDFQNCLHLESLGLSMKPDLKLPNLSVQRLSIANWSLGLFPPLCFDRLPSMYLESLQSLRLISYPFDILTVSQFPNLSRLTIVCPKMNALTRINIAPSGVLEIEYIMCADHIRVTHSGSGRYTINRSHWTLSGAEYTHFLLIRDYIRFDTIKSCITSLPMTLVKDMAEAVNLKRVESFANNLHLVTLGDLAHFTKLKHLTLHIAEFHWRRLCQSSTALESLKNLTLYFLSSYQTISSMYFYFPPNLTHLTIRHVQFCFELLHHLPTQLQFLQIIGSIAMNEMTTLKKSQPWWITTNPLYKKAISYFAAQQDLEPINGIAPLYVDEVCLELSCPHQSLAEAHIRRFLPHVERTGINDANDMLPLLLQTKPKPKKVLY